MLCQFASTLYSQHFLFSFLFVPIFDKKSLPFPNTFTRVWYHVHYPDFRERVHIRNSVTMISPGTINFVLETSLGFEAQLGGQWPVNLLARPW